MAVKAVFEADVNHFKVGVETATKDLESFNTTLKLSDAELKTFQATADATSGTIASRLHGSIGAFDALLRAAGINIGKESRALQELAGAADQTFTSLGALGTAGLVVSTALASWDLGRWIAGMFDLDRVIGDATAKALGLGDVLGQQAAAGAEALAAASRLAHREITDMAEAMKVVRESGGGAALTALAKSWSDDLAQLATLGKLDEFTKMVDSHQYSVKQIAEAYGLAADSVVHFEQTLRDSDKALADQQRATDAWAKGLLEAQDRWAAENRRGMEDWEKALERNYQLEMRLYLDAIKQQDILNEKVLKQYTQKELQTGLTITAAKDVAASNVARTQGAVLPDVGLAAATQLEKDLDKANQVYADSAKAMGEVAANLRQAADELARQAYLNYDVRTGARRPEAGIAGPEASTTTNNVSISVSGLLDPRTISELTTAISQELMRRSGRIYPSA